MSICYTHDNLKEVAQLLIENGTDVNAKNFEGWTALQLMCRYYIHDNLIELIQLMIQHGADVTVKLSDGWTVLHQLCRHYILTVI